MQLFGGDGTVSYGSVIAGMTAMSIYNGPGGQANGIHINQSTGNVGIGTASAAAKFAVLGEGTGRVLAGSAGFGGNYSSISLNGTLSTTNYNFSSAPTDSTLYLNRPAGAPIAFRESNGANQMTIASGGNVGIGTTGNPAEKLEVAGNVKATGGQLISTAAGGTAPLVVTSATLVSNLNAALLNGLAFTAFAPATGSTVYVAKAGDTMAGTLLVLSGGKVGIGTAAPSGPLHVERTQAGANWAYFYNNVGLNNPAQVPGPLLGWNRSDGFGESLVAFNSSVTPGTNKRLSLAEYDGSFFFEHLTVNPGGNVGIGKLNQIVFLKPLGGTQDDSPQINDAIDKLPANGGIIRLTPGLYNLSSNITNVQPSGVKQGVKLRGYGGGWAGFKLFGDRLTRLKWMPSSPPPGDGAIIRLEASASHPQENVQDFDISDLTIDGNNVVGTIGLVLDQVASSLFRNLEACNATEGIRLTTSATLADVDCAWNLFENCTANNVSRGVVLSGNGNTDQPANSAHNTFIGLSILFFGDAGILLEKCDNNMFDRTWIYQNAGTGFGVVVDDPRNACCNYFYHLQPGGGFRVNHADTPEQNGNKNLIFGYDHGNNQPGPTTSPANLQESVLFWINSKGQMRGLVP